MFYFSITGKLFAFLNHKLLAFSLAFVWATMVVLVLGVKTEPNYEGQISMLWSLTLYEMFKDYLVYRPKRGDYDLIACKTNEIVVAHVFLFIAFIVSGDWK